MREHRIGLEGNRSAIRLDGLERPLGDDRGIALGNQPVEFPLVGEGREGQGAGQPRRPPR
jgi:hypothetical protein